MDSVVPTIDLDRTREVPLHRQIAAQLRFRIASGELAPGAALPSLRSAAAHWNVHMHTVRRAYESLRDEGLVKTAPRSGTRVAPAAHDRTGDLDGFRAFLRSVRAAADRNFNVSVEQVVDGLRLLTKETEDQAEPFWFVECSASLAAGLAEQVRRRWGVDIRPWTLDRLAELPPGPVLGTLYHVRELRNLARSTFREVHYVQVRVDVEPIEQLLGMLTAAGPRLVLYGVDCESALVIASEVRQAVDGALDIHVEVGTDPARALREGEPGAPILFSPENWDRLDRASRANERAFAYRTLIVPEELEALGSTMGWVGD